MRKLILFLSLSFLFSQIIAQINFVHYDKEKLFTEAHQQQKFIFVDVFTDWCGPCIRMSRQVFTDSLVAAIYNEKILAYKANAELESGIEWRVKYNVQYFPSYLFFNSNGRLICKTGSGMSKELFIQETNRALSCDGTKSAYIQNALDAEKMMNSSYRKRKIEQADTLLSKSLSQQKYLYNLYLGAKLATIKGDKRAASEYAKLCVPKLEKLKSRFTNNKYSKKPIPTYILNLENEVNQMIIKNK